MTASEPNLPSDFSDVEEIGRDSGRLRVSLEILVAVLILVGIYFLFAPEEQSDLPPLQNHEIDPIIRAQIDSAQADQQATSEASAPAGNDTAIDIATSESPAPGATAKQTEQPVNRPLAEGEAARAIIAAQRRGDDTRPLPEIDRLASDYQQQGRLTDAYLLWFYAARQGDGEAAFSLAGLYDPNHFEPGNSLVDSADATQAYKWYLAAARQSIPQAAERLQALRTSLQAQADAGDMTARRLLLNWQ
jgi:TPR repeat protein